MVKKQTILEKIQKKLDKIEDIREKEETLLEDIVELIDNESESFEDNNL
tara:strand:+ start:1157 stop:1303 length:147 start_codon:yes stop_codon:yes gene_type:complete